MTRFDSRLAATLAEMAQVAGWVHPTTHEFEVVYVDDEGHEEVLDKAAGPTPEEALEKFVADHGDLIGDMATANETTVPEYVSHLRAVEPAIGDGLSTVLTKSDKKSITGGKTERTVTAWLNANPLPHKILFKFGSDEIEDVPTPGVITFVKLGNAGGDTLTPHMILHTLGHALVGYNVLPTAERLYNLFESLGHPIHDADDLIMPVSKLLHMRAAKLTILNKNRGFPTFEELLNEVTGVYVKNGRIKIAPNEYCDYQITPEQCDYVKKVFETSCRGFLDRAVGRVIYDD